MNRRYGVILSYVLMVFEVLSTLLLTPFIIDKLGQAEYGVYKLSAAIIVYLLLLDLGVGNAVIRYVSKFRANDDKVQAQKFLGVATLFYGGVGLLSFIVGLILIYYFPVIFAKGLNADEILLGQKLMFLTILNVVVTLCTSAYVNTIIAYEKFVLSKGLSILLTILKIFAFYLVVDWGYGSMGIVSVALFLTIIGRGVQTIYVFKGIKLYPVFKNIDMGFVKEICAYSVLIFFQMVATLMNQTVDQLLIGMCVASSAALIAIYSIGSQIVQYFQSIASSFTGVLMPGIVHLIESNATSKQITDEMVRLGRLILMVMGLIWACFLVYGDEFVLLWVGKQNMEAYYVALILMFAQTLVIVESVGTQVLWAKNMHKEQSYLKLIVVILNILLTYILVLWEPILGATIGTFISLMIGDVIVMLFVFKKKLGLNIKYYYSHLFKGILPALLFTIIVGYLFKSIFSISWPTFILHSLIMCLTYTIVMYFGGINQQEKSFFRSLLRMKRNKVQ